MDSLKKFKLCGKDTTAACFIQLVLTSIWGIPVMSVKFLKTESDLLLQPIKTICDDVTLGWNQNIEVTSSRGTQ